MSVNTVRKYVTELEDRGLIRTERTTVTTRTDAPSTAVCVTTSCPSRCPSKQFYERQLHAADLALERQRAEQRMAGAEEKGVCIRMLMQLIDCMIRAGPVSVSTAHHRHAAVHCQPVEPYARGTY